MNVNKEFIKILANAKTIIVGDLVQKMDFLEIQEGSIMNLQNRYEKLEEIYYTLWFLERNDLIEIVSGDWSDVTFSIADIKLDDYVVDRLSYINELNKENWGKRIKILPAFYEYVKNDYLTKESHLEWTKIRLAFIVAIVTAVATGFSTALFEIWLQ